MAAKSFRKYLGEAFLIVFSVLFALFINNLAQNHQTKKKKKTALESIRKELHKNAAIVAGWRTEHAAISERLQDLINGKNDSLKNRLLEYENLELRLLTDNKSLIEAILSDTAWESAKSSGIVSEFDFSATQSLTAVYDMQNVMTDETVMKILDLYFDRESHNMDNLMATLYQFGLRFYELVGQEYLMEQLYNNAIKDVEANIQSE